MHIICVEVHSFKGFARTKVCKYENKLHRNFLNIQSSFPTLYGPGFSLEDKVPSIA